MLTRVAALCMIVMVSSTALAQSADESFKEGISAFKQNRFKDAIALFKKAKEAGMSGLYLEYNLGSTYYRLEKYKLAKDSFLRVAKHEEFRQVAHYNLGLIARRLKDYNAALEWFKKAQAEENGQKAIIDLAAKMITKVNGEIAPDSVKRIASKATKTVVSAGENSLMPVNDGNLYSSIKDSISRNSSALRVNSYNDPATTEEVSRGTANDVEILETPQKVSAKKGKVRGGVQIAVGIDDNIEQVGIEGSTGIEDQYVEFFGYVSVPLTAKWKALGNIYTGIFTDSDEDYTAITAGIQYRHKLDGWSIIPNLNYITSSLGSKDYQDIVDFKLTGQKKLGAGKWLTLRYRFSDISAQNPDYLYEEGSRNQFRVDYYTRIAFGKLRFRYELETNDRDDEGEPINASPTRHTFKARLSHKFAEKWNASGELEFRTSDYETDGYKKPGPPIEDAFRDREDERFRVRLDVNRSMNKQWSLGVLYVFTDNESNISNAATQGNDFSYTKNDIQIYSHWRF